MPENSTLPVVIFVDDELEILKAIQRTFRQEPYEVKTTSDPLEALDWLKKGPVGVIVADQRMPQMRGTELLHLSKEIAPNTARVLLTAFPGDTLVIKGMGLADLSLVGKPWEDEAIRNLIRTRLAERGLLPR